MKLFVGVDTSCYTTSLAAVDDAGGVVFDGRRVLPVEPGQRGLRQSEALFRHLRQLEPLFGEYRAAAGAAAIGGVAASVRPRPQDDSYLPVFLAGTIAGRAMAAAAGVPFTAVTHQEAHLRAALMDEGDPPARFLGVHLSGGTTEVLAAERTAEGFSLEILGGTEDLHAGQFLDRLGVAMGLPFPAGPALEELARAGRARNIPLPVAVRGLRLSFSGPLSAAERALARGADRADLAAAAQVCLYESVGRLLGEAVARTGLETVVLGGGVSSNRGLREELRRMLPAVRFIFARPGLAVDNAVGVALLALDRG